MNRAQHTNNKSQHFPYLHWFYKPHWCCCWCPETDISSVYCIQLNKLRLKKKTVSSLRNVVFYIKDTAVDNLQNCDSYNNVPSPQTYR
jgi:hypothetical protein